MCEKANQEKGATVISSSCAACEKTVSCLHSVSAAALCAASMLLDSLLGALVALVRQTMIFYCSGIKGGKRPQLLCFLIAVALPSSLLLKKDCKHGLYGINSAQQE